MLEIKNLTVEVVGDPSKIVVKNLSLSVMEGQVHAIMGPNGSGKTSLLYAIMGHPNYRVVEGDILLDNKSIINLSPDERSLKGIFLTFQSPMEIPGVKLSTLLVAARNKRIGSDDLLKVEDARVLKDMRIFARDIGLGPEFLRREINYGFSGGEKKKSELLQALIINPRFMLLDEPDTGLDIDSIKNIARYIKESAEKGIGILLVTHYARILNYVVPDKVSIIVDGELVDSGGPELAHVIESEGYRRYGVIEA
jgi:Fe-S cluster assembly ATP-binding protein